MTCIITLSFIKRRRRMLAGMVPSIVFAIKNKENYRVFNKYDCFGFVYLH